MKITGLCFPCEKQADALCQCLRGLLLAPKIMWRRQEVRLQTLTLFTDGSNPSATIIQKAASENGAAKTTRQYDNQVLHTNFSRLAEVSQRLRFTRNSVTRHPPQVLRLLRVLKLEWLCLEPTMDLALQNPSREVVIIWMNSSFSIIYILFFIT